MSRFELVVEETEDGSCERLTWTRLLPAYYSHFTRAGIVTCFVNYELQLC